MSMFIKCEEDTLWLNNSFLINDTSRFQRFTVIFILRYVYKCMQLAISLEYSPTPCLILTRFANFFQIYHFCQICNFTIEAPLDRNLANIQASWPHALPNLIYINWCYSFVLIRELANEAPHDRHVHVPSGLGVWWTACNTARISLADCSNSRVTVRISWQIININNGHQVLVT